MASAGAGHHPHVAVASERSASDIIVLCVGGTKFVTTWGTLTKHQDSLLGGMFLDGNPKGSRYDGGWFIDRSPLHFDAILQYLRDGSVPLPDSSLERQQLRAEAAFYRLTQLAALIDAEETERKHQQTAQQARLETERNAEGFCATVRAEQVRTALEAVVAEQHAVERSLQAAAKARALLQQLEDSVQQHQQQLAALPPEQPRQHEAARAAIALLESQQQRVQADLASAEDRARRAHARYQTAQLAKMCALGADLESAKAQLAVIVPPEEPSGLPTPAVVRRRVGDKGRNQMNE